jgi:hypothetical protein
MSPSECTHSNGTGGWSPCHFLYSSSSTTRPESTCCETTHQAIGSRRKPTTKEHAEKIRTEIDQLKIYIYKFFSSLRFYIIILKLLKIYRKFKNLLLHSYQKTLAFPTRIVLSVENLDKIIIII